MRKKLDCIVVDDDEFSLSMIEDICKHSKWARIIKSFNCPKKFLDTAHEVKFDLCLLDINMPKIDGLQVAKIVNDKPIIFITGLYDKLKDALDIAPVDIVTKPFKKQRLEKAFEKANAQLGRHRPVEYTLFNIAESDKKMRIHLNDILFVRSDIADPRNKHVYLKGGGTYTLMNCTFERLLDLCPALIKVNRTELISSLAVHMVKHDVITLNGVYDNNKPRRVSLSDNCRKGFIDFIHY
jgi:DNA-binding LytR/AlgR family response regulator